jgi:hypothetical protein
MCCGVVLPAVWSETIRALAAASRSYTVISRPDGKVELAFLGQEDV